MRVAVTTNDLETVDVPFGRARHVVVYEVRRDRAHLQRVFAFDAPPARCDRRALRQRGAALEGCVVLFTLEIGEGAGRSPGPRGASEVDRGRPRDAAAGPRHHAPVVARGRARDGGAGCALRQSSRARRGQASYRMSPDPATSYPAIAPTSRRNALLCATSQSRTTRGSPRSRALTMTP